MKVAIVNAKELFDPQKNPTLCMSALRGLKMCHQCPKFKRHLQILRGGSVNVGKPHTLTCGPQLTNEALDLLEEKEQLLEKLAIIRAELEYVNDELEG